MGLSAKNSEIMVYYIYNIKYYIYNKNFISTFLVLA